MKKVFLSVVLVLALSATVISCRDTKKEAEETATEAVEATEDAVEEAAEAVEEAVDTAAAAVEEAVDSITQ